MTDETMVSASKYLFERSFAPEDIAAEEKAQAEKKAAPTYDEAQLQAACAQARTEGHQAGLAEARTEIEQIVANTLTSVEASIGDIMRRYDEDFQAIRRDAADMSVTIARKLAPALIARQPAMEVEALVNDCLADLREEPRIVVRASVMVVETLKPRIDDIAARSAFGGRVILLPDDDLQGADCRVEWADGGAERDSAALESQIQDAITRFVSGGLARGQPQAGPDADAELEPQPAADTETIQTDAGAELEPQPATETETIQTDAGAELEPQPAAETETIQTDADVQMDVPNETT